MTSKGFGNKIYAYTDEDRYEGRIARKLRPRLKVGGTGREVAKDRIDEQDGTSQPVALVQKRVYTTTFWDTGFHKWLEDHGYVRVRKNREWFEIYVEELDKEIEAYSKHLESFSYEIKGNYIPRTLQTKVSEEVCNLWNGNTIIQPLDLCPRFGKDFTHLDVFKRSGFRVMIIASYWLGSNESLIKTVNERLDVSADIEVIKPNYDLYVKALREGKRVLIDVSLHVDSDKIDSRLLDVLKEEDALIVVDEADYGAWTDTSRSILHQYSECGNNLVLLSTGSNIERAMIGAKGDIQTPIRYTYADLITLKKQGDETYKELVEVTCYNLDATQAFIDEQNNMLPEDRLNMKKLFDKRNTHVQREFKKQVLFDKERGNDVFGIYSRHWGQIDHPAVMVWCPTTKSNLNSLAKVCKDPDYNIIVLHGDEHTNRGAEEYVEESIKQAEEEGKEGTVIFSCGMGARSFSIPNIIATVDCFDGGSLAPATQRASRCLTPGCDKEMSLVVNYTFNPNRSSSFETDLISSEINKDGDTDSAVRRIHGVINTLKDRDTFMSEKDFREYITSSQNLRNMASATIDYSEMYNNTELRELLHDMKKQIDTNKKKGIIDDAKTYIDNKEKKKTQKEINEERKAQLDFRSKVLKIVNSAGNISYLALNTKSFKEGLEIISNDPDKDLAYKSLVGLNASVVLDKFYPYFNKTYMDLIVSKNTISGTYNDFSYETCDHPIGLFDNVINNTINKNILYFAKEPGFGVLDDLEKCSVNNNVTVVSCSRGYVDFYRKKGYNVVGLDDDYLLPILLSMKFDVLLANFPFGDDNSPGNKRGGNPLWFKLTQLGFKFLKDDGIACIISPTTIVSGADTFTKGFLGKDRQYDLKDVDFSADDHFDVGTKICKWTAIKSKTEGNKVKINDGRELDTDNTLHITRDSKLDNILSQLFYANEPKLNFNVSKAYDYRAVAKYLKKNDLPVEWAKDLKQDKDDDYCHRVNINGKIKYSRVKYINDGVWRVFYPQLQDPTDVTVDNKTEAGGSTFTMVFNNEEDAKQTQKYLIDPIYDWIIDKTRVNGRVTNIISKFPNAPIEEVLNAESLGYIQEQLANAS